MCEHQRRCHCHCLHKHCLGHIYIRAAADENLAFAAAVEAEVWGFDYFRIRTLVGTFVQHCIEC